MIKYKSVNTLFNIGWLVAVLFIVNQPAMAQVERPGSTSAQFLDIGVYPRAESMGGALVSLADGADAAYYNPSALVMVDGTVVSLNHTKLFANINHEFLSIVHRVPGVGTFGISTTALYTEQMKVRTPLEPDGTGETFSSSNLKVGLSYAWKLTGRVSFGASVNYIRLDYFQDFNANAFSADISTLYRSNFRGFRIGMMIANFGSNVTVINETYPLPTKFEFGMGINAIQAENMKVKVAATGVKPYNGSPRVKTGIEWGYDDMFFLRGGYRPYHDSATYSAGAGLKTAIGSSVFSFDYSLSQYRLLSMVHRLGISVAF